MTANTIGGPTIPKAMARGRNIKEIRVTIYILSERRKMTSKIVTSLLSIIFFQNHVLFHCEDSSFLFLVSMTSPYSLLTDYLYFSIEYQYKGNIYLTGA